MKEHPLLMQGPLVRATLEGRKTQTRRPVKGNPRGEFMGWAWTDETTRSPGLWMQGAWGQPLMCPLGRAGDRLWVRETWRPASEESDPPIDGRPIRDGRWCYYRATQPDVEHEDCSNRSPWHPSIHMPRWACRLVLPVVSVRVERAQDISEADAKAEGVEPLQGSYREGFRAVWRGIYGTWDLNLWVWVGEYEPCE